MIQSKTVCWCDLCGAELEVGDACYRLNGLCVCPDCLPEFARGFFRTALEVIA